MKIQTRAEGMPTPQCSMQPLAQLAVAFALGLFAARYFSFPLRGLLVSVVLLATLAIGAVVYQRLRLAAFLVTIAMSFTGLALAIQNSRVPENQLRSLIERGAIVPGEPVEITGVLERDPEIGPQRLYLQLRLEKTRSRSDNSVLASSERETSGAVLLLATISTAAAQKEFEQLDLRYGARVRVMTLLERADNFRNPGVSSFTEFLDRKGYDATGFVKSPLLVERLNNQRVFLPLAFVYEWRRRLQAQIDLRFSTETAGVLDAAVLGNRYNLSHATAERFRDGGTFHVLVISGLHITFIGGLVLLVARRFSKNKTFQFVSSIAVLWTYVLAVGAESSVVRAALMFTLVVLAPILARRASSINALGGAALVLLALRPGDLLDPSFQLTFVSVLAIVVVAWPLLQKMATVGGWRPTRGTPYPPACSGWLRILSESLFWSERAGKRELERATYDYRLFKTPLAASLERFHVQRLLRYLFATLVVSVAVQLMLLPFLVVYFHRVSLASFVLNVGVSVLMAAAAIVAGFALLVGQGSVALSASFVAVANSLVWLMVHSVDPFAAIGVASVRIPEYTARASIVYGLYYLPLAALLVLLARWQPLKLPLSKSRHKQRILPGLLIAQLLGLAVIIVHPGSEGAATGKLRVDFLDVGQGDAALVTFPDNTTLLIDGGGKPGPLQKQAPKGADDSDAEMIEPETRSIGESVVSEYLWWRGLDHVDYVLATHADADHIDGLNDVARNFKVRAALIARAPETDDEYIRFTRTLADRSVPSRLIAAGDVLEFGKVKVEVLWPSPLANPNANSRNNDSLVLRLRFGEQAILLTGDIEREGEQGMLDAGADLRADVIKIAHHGSKTSSSQPLVESVRPRYAIISVGQTSIFGHPDPEVVERWKNSGAQVLTTGKCGTITVVTDGHELSVETFVKPR